MTESMPGTRRFLFPNGEVANTISHGFGLVASIAAVPLLMMMATKSGNSLYVVGVTVFAVSVVLLYLASTVYHSLDDGPAKRFFRLIDHSAIFLLIAGSYTPFTLGALKGPWGWTLLVLIWLLATVGLTLKIVFRTRYSWASIVLYVVMGWLALVAIKPIWLNVPLPGILLILAGGVAYTAGLGFFAAHRLRFNHFIWHLFVIAGTTCHFFAVLWYSNK